MKNLYSDLLTFLIPSRSVLILIKNFHKFLGFAIICAKTIKKQKKVDKIITNFSQIPEISHFNGMKVVRKFKNLDIFYPLSLTPQSLFRLKNYFAFMMSFFMILTKCTVPTKVYYFT